MGDAMILNMILIVLIAVIIVVLLSYFNSGWSLRTKLIAILFPVIGICVLMAFAQGARCDNLKKISSEGAE